MMRKAFQSGRNHVNILLKNQFLRNIGILASGTIFGQAIMIIALPLLTRLYTPQDFNLLAVYAALVMVLSVAGCARLELAIPLVKSDEDAINVLALTVISATMLSLILAVIVLLFPDALVRLLRQPKLGPYLWMFPVGVWIACLYTAMQFWAVRKNRFKEITATQLVRATGSVSSQIGLAYLKFASFGLLFGHMIYGGLGIVGLTRSMLKYEGYLLKEVSLKRAKKNLSKYRNFPLFSVPESLLDAAANNVPIVLIAAINSSSEAGFFLLAQRVLSVPIALLGRNISRVYLAEAPVQMEQNSLGPFTRKIIRNLFKVGILPFLAIALLAPFAFPIVFGENWARSGIMVAWMVPFMFLQFISAPVATIMHVTGNQRMAFFLQLFGFILLIGSIILAAVLDKGLAFEFFAVASIIYYSAYLGCVMYLSRNQE